MEQVPQGVECVEKNQSEPNTGVDLAGAWAVVDQDGAAYGLGRVNRKTVTVSGAGEDTIDGTSTRPTASSPQAGMGR